MAEEIVQENAQDSRINKRAVGVVLGGVTAVLLGVGAGGYLAQNLYGNNGVGVDSHSNNDGEVDFSTDTDRGSYEITEERGSEMVSYHHNPEGIGWLFIYKKGSSSSKRIVLRDDNGDNLVDLVSNDEIGYERSDKGTEELFRRADQKWNEYVPRLRELAKAKLEEMAKIKPEEHFDF